MKNYAQLAHHNVKGYGSWQDCQLGNWAMIQLKTGSREEVMQSKPCQKILDTYLSFVQDNLRGANGSFPGLYVCKIY